MAKQVNKIDVDALTEENKMLKEAVKILMDHVKDTNGKIDELLKERFS